MAKKHKILLALISAGILLFLLTFFLNERIESEIENSISGIMEYEEIEMNVLGNSMLLNNPKMEISGKKFAASEIKIEGLNYYNFLIRDKIVIDKVFLKNPEISVVQKNQDSVPRESREEFQYDILIHNFIAEDGNFSLAENDSVSNELFIAFEDFGLENVVINETLLKNDIPFKFSSYEFSIDSLKYNFDDLHYLTLVKATSKKGSFSIQNLKIVPNYNKIEFQQHIPFEKDRFKVNIEEISSNDFSWEIKNDTLALKIPLLVVSNMDLEAYRNKLISDDKREKLLYGAQVRNLPIKIDFEKIQVVNSLVVYEEKSNAERPPLKVYFEQLYATIFNLSNTNLEREDFPTTNIGAKALFMGSAPVKLNWNFNIGNPQTNFQISGTLGSLSSEDINAFLTPALNIRAEGGINSMAFNYSGNANIATGEMKLKYDKFKIEILQKEEKKVNEFLSAIANIFINNEGTTGDFTQENLQVERDKTKSFWNYLWLMVKEGALKVFL